MTLNNICNILSVSEHSSSDPVPGFKDHDVLDAAVEEMVGGREAGHACSNDYDSWHSDLSWTVSVQYLSNVLFRSSLECTLYTASSGNESIKVSYDPTPRFKHL